MSRTLCCAACLALPAFAWACFCCLVSIFLKKGAFLRISGKTMKRTWLPRRKQLEGGSGQRVR